MVASFERIDQVIAKGIRWLKAQQNPNGGYGGWGVGSTSLAIMALLDAGLSLSDEAVAKGISYLLDYQPANSTYFRSLTIMALTATGEKTLDFLSKVQEDTAWLVKSQGNNPEDQLTYGGWGHTANFKEADGSNTLIALLALYASSLWGMDIPEGIWHRALTWYQRNYELNQDGSCVFRLGNNEQFSSQQVTRAVTAGALAALKSIQLFISDKHIIGQALELEDRITKWLDINYSVPLNTKEAPSSWYYNYLFNLYKGAEIEAYPILLGDDDWHNDTIELLIKHQQSDGRWVGEPEQQSTDVVYTSLALLSLTSNIPNENDHTEQGAFEADLAMKENIDQELDDKQKDLDKNEIAYEERNETKSHDRLEVVVNEGREPERDADWIGKADVPEEFELRFDQVKGNCVVNCPLKTPAYHELGKGEAHIDPVIQMPASGSWPGTSVINQVGTESTSSSDTWVNAIKPSGSLYPNDTLITGGLNGSDVIETPNPDVNDISLSRADAPSPSVTFFQPMGVISVNYANTNTNGEMALNSGGEKTQDKGKSPVTSVFVYGTLLCAMMLGFFVSRKEPFIK